MNTVSKGSINNMPITVEKLIKIEPFLGYPTAAVAWTSRTVMQAVDMSAELAERRRQTMRITSNANSPLTKTRATLVIRQKSMKEPERTVESLLSDLGTYREELEDRAARAEFAEWWGLTIHGTEGKEDANEGYCCEFSEEVAKEAQDSLSVVQQRARALTEIMKSAPTQVAGEL
jgi:hypothetical protein